MIIPNISKNNKMFQTTNQYIYIYIFPMQPSCWSYKAPLGDTDTSRSIRRLLSEVGSPLSRGRQAGHFLPSRSKYGIPDLVMSK